METPPGVRAPGVSPLLLARLVPVYKHHERARGARLCLQITLPVGGVVGKGGVEKGRERGRGGLGAGEGTGGRREGERGRRAGREVNRAEIAGKNKAEGAQVEFMQSLLINTATPSCHGNCHPGSARNERENILFRFINLKMKPACREGDSSSQSVIVEPHAPDTGIHLSCRL